MSQFSLILTIGVAIAAFISPVAVALINNRHSRKLRSAELKHAECMKRIECHYLLDKEQLSLSFQNKNDAFTELVRLSGEFYNDNDNTELLSKLYSAIYKASMYCSSHESQNSITGFVYHVNTRFHSSADSDTLETFKYSMEQLTHALRLELSKSIISKDK